MIRIGKVTGVYEKECTVRVEYQDLDGQVSGKLKVLQNNTLKNNDFFLPDIGELVCILQINAHLGFVLGSFYSESVPVPESFQKKEIRCVRFEDGTTVVYDRENSVLSVDIQGDVNGNVEKDFTLNITGEAHITITGDVDITYEAGFTETAEKDISITSEKKITQKAGEDMILLSDKKIKLGSDEADEPVIKGKEYKKEYDTLVDMVKNHTHEVPQAPSGTTTSAVSSSLAGLQKLPDETLSQAVMTS